MCGEKLMVDLFLWQWGIKIIKNCDLKNVWFMRGDIYMWINFVITLNCWEKKTIEQRDIPSYVCISILGF